MLHTRLKKYIECLLFKYNINEFLYLIDEIQNIVNNIFQYQFTAQAVQ